MRGAIPTLPQYIFMAWCLDHWMNLHGVIVSQAQGQLYLALLNETVREMYLGDPTSSESSHAEESVRAQYPYCNGKFSHDKKGDKCIRYSRCFTWCHEDCASGSCDSIIFARDVFLDGYTKIFLTSAFYVSVQGNFSISVHNMLVCLFLYLIKHSCIYI